MIFISRQAILPFFSRYISATQRCSSWMTHCHQASWLPERFLKLTLGPLGAGSGGSKLWTDGGIVRRSRAVTTTDPSNRHSTIGANQTLFSRGRIIPLTLKRSRSDPHG